MHRGRFARMPAGISGATRPTLQPLGDLAPALPAAGGMGQRTGRDQQTRVSVSSIARRRPLMLFFVLAFAFSWVVWAPAVFLLPHGASKPQTSAALLHLLGSL